MRKGKGQRHLCGEMDKATDTVAEELWAWGANFRLSVQTIAGLKRQLLELLSANSFVARGMRSRAVEGLGRRMDGSDGVRLALQVSLFRHPWLPPAQRPLHA